MACGNDNVTGVAGGRNGMLRLDLPEMDHDAADLGMLPTRANKLNGYFLGSYRIATAPEPNSSRLTSLKSAHRFISRD